VSPCEVLLPNPFYPLPKPLRRRITHTKGIDHIVERKLCDEWVELEEEGERLADTTCARGREGQRQLEPGWVTMRSCSARAGSPAAPQTTALTILMKMEWSGVVSAVWGGLEWFGGMRGSRYGM
jgi:hypothetical protein